MTFLGVLSDLFRGLGDRKVTWKKLVNIAQLCFFTLLCAWMQPTQPLSWLVNAWDFHWRFNRRIPNTTKNAGEIYSIHPRFCLNIKQVYS